jgi:hypothetical protein
MGDILRCREFAVGLAKNALGTPVLRFKSARKTCRVEPLGAKRSRRDGTRFYFGGWMR